MSEVNRYTATYLKFEGGEIVCSVDTAIEVVSAFDYDALAQQLASSQEAERMLQKQMGELSKELAARPEDKVIICECGPLRNITEGGHFPACTRCHRRLKP